MKRLTAATSILTATAIATATLSAPASAHHSQSMFDTTQEIVIEGTVSRFDWVNPHMYLVVATKGPDGQPALVEGEGVGITQALVDGLDRNALTPGTPVVVRANPNRGGWGKQVRIMDVTTAGRRSTSLLFRESQDAHPDAGREPRGSLGAVARGVRRGDGGHGALADHGGGPRRSGGARR